jgi:hypothetical protein
MWHAWGTGAVRTVKWGNIMEGDHLEDLGIYGIIVLK